MGIDADFRMNIPTNADYPDGITVERDAGETKEYLHPGILDETERELRAALDGQDQYREQCRIGFAENSVYREALEKISEGKPFWVKVAQTALASVSTRLNKLHPDCCGPWEKGQTSYPTGEHIADCDKRLEWNRQSDRHSPDQSWRERRCIKCGKDVAPTECQCKERDFV